MLRVIRRRRDKILRNHLIAFHSFANADIGCVNRTLAVSPRFEHESQTMWMLCTCSSEFDIRCFDLMGIYRETESSIFLSVLLSLSKSRNVYTSLRYINNPPRCEIERGWLNGFLRVAINGLPEIHRNDNWHRNQHVWHVLRVMESNLFAFFH